MRNSLLAVITLAVLATSHARAQAPAAPHNIVLFVADGLRFRMVDDSTAPTMAALAREGVTLRNSHSVFPTFTTANASAMATGHMLGDTGDFSNVIYTGAAIPSAANSVTPFLESDPILADVDERFSGNYLDEDTILKLARDKGYSTAAVGKVGPTLIFDHTKDGRAHTIIVDDQTGTDKGVPLSAQISDRLKAAGLALAAPPRGANGKFGNMSTPGTLSANIEQQDYRSFSYSGRAIPMAPSTIRATASIPSSPASMGRPRLPPSATPTTIWRVSATACARSGSLRRPTSSPSPITASRPLPKRAPPVQP
jgi:hypothetical protein